MAEEAPVVADCVFCEIVAGRQPSSTIYRDDVCAAFLDTQPVNPGHLLIAPNVHAACLADLDEETGAHMFRVAQRLAGALRRCGVQCEGINLFLADGAAAMQEVFHVHLHVVPRYERDGFGFRFSPAYYQKPARAELDRVAEQIRKTL
jgi:histidine triad (HIT) family protein